MLRVSWTLVLLAAALLVNSQDPGAGNTDTTPASSAPPSDSTPPTDSTPATNGSSSESADNSTASPEGGQSSPAADSKSKMELPPSPKGGVQGRPEGGEKEQNETRLPLHQAKIPATVPVKQSTVTYRLQWKDAPDNGGSITKYNIIYYPRDQPKRQKNANSVADYVDLKDLVPGDIYQAHVQAENEYGVGEPLSITFKTQSVVNNTDNSQQTCTTQIIDLSATSLLLDFDGPEYNLLDVEGYDVKYVRADEHFDQPVVVPFQRADHFLVKGLQPATRYRFRITTRSGGRSGGQPCGEFDTITREVGPPLAPKPVLGSTVSFHLQWETPDNDSVKHYKVDYWANPLDKQQEIVEAPKNSLTLISLAPCTKYHVEISPRGKPRDHGNRNGPQARKQKQLPRTAHVIQLDFTTDCTKVSGCGEFPVFTL